MVPGQGVDFTQLAHVLMLVLGLYIAASLFSWAQGYLLTGAVQRTIYQLRADVEDKINRLPLEVLRPAVPRRDAEPGHE